MVTSLYFLVLFLFLFLFLALVAMIAQSNNSEKYYSDLDIDEWDCHECGYHVQVGNICIYCNAKKQNNIKTDHANAK